MLSIVKIALRVSGTAFDTEIQNLIDDCIAELQMLGITFTSSSITDPQIKTAIILYCKWKFGDCDHPDRWKADYEEKVSKLKIAANYRPVEE